MPFFGANGRIRTGDLFITSELLYQLSHISIHKDYYILFFQKKQEFSKTFFQFFYKTFHSFHRAL